MRIIFILAGLAVTGYGIFETKRLKKIATGHPYFQALNEFIASIVLTLFVPVGIFLIIFGLVR